MELWASVGTAGLHPLSKSVLLQGSSLADAFWVCVLLHQTEGIIQCLTYKLAASLCLALEGNGFGLFCLLPISPEEPC